MPHEEFVQYHREPYDPLFTSVSEGKQHVRRYVQCHANADTVSGLPDSRIDGTTELGFDDLAGLAAVFASQRNLELIRPDEQKFLGFVNCEYLVGTECPVIG